MRERSAILATVDLILVNLAVLVALGIWALRGDKAFDGDFLVSELFWFLLLSLMWVLFASLSGMYDLHKLSNLNATVVALFQTMGMVVFAYLAVYFVALPNTLPRLVVFYHAAATVVLVGAWRAIYGGLASREAFRHRLIVVGAGCAGRTIAAAMREHYGAHFEIVGFVDDDPVKVGQAIEGIPVIGSREHLAEIVREQEIAEVVLAITRNLSGEMFRALLDVQEQGVQITPMSILYEQITSRVPVEYIGDSWYIALPLGHAGTGRLYSAAKRVMDLIVACVGLLILGILMPFIALAIRLDSPGPIFYRQERVGKGGRVFPVWKLRTMITNAEPDGRAVWAMTGDPRVTRTGKLLRKARVDEFPQFVNILRGEMSAVGPRPERPEFVYQLENTVPFYRLRHAVKPGMAGWAVVNYDYVDNVESARVRVEYDLYYIKHQSLWLDTLILFRTLGQVVALKGR